MADTFKYTHENLEEAVICPHGYYTPLKEARLEYNNREVLYMVGYAVMESTCCGSTKGKYVIVPGYVVRWQGTTNDDGLPVSEVEPISNEEVRKNIRQTIREAESISQIEFW